MQATAVQPQYGLDTASRSWVVAASVRKSEWVILAFLVYAALVGEVIPIAANLRTRTLLLNAALFFGYLLLIRADMMRPRLTTGVLRDWLALALILLAYREMGWFALPHTTHPLELRWILWDRLVLRGGLKAAIESLGPVLPSVLEISYALVYALAPFCLVVLYASGRRESVPRFLFVFAVGVLLCYAQFPLWPSDPPRTLFPGEDAPLYLTIFRRFNWWMLAGAGIHTSVFPSAHVAGAFSAAFGMKRATGKCNWLQRMLVTIAALIAVATVYGRYHYLADATAGLFMAFLALAFSRWLEDRHSSTVRGGTPLWHRSATYR